MSLVDVQTSVKSLRVRKSYSNSPLGVVQTGNDWLTLNKNDSERNLHKIYEVCLQLILLFFNGYNMWGFL